MTANGDKLPKYDVEIEEKDEFLQDIKPDAPSAPTADADPA